MSNVHPLRPYDDFVNGRDQPDLFGDQSGQAIWHEDAAWDEANIPRRPWIVPGYLMRGAVTVLSGPGSAGKSMLTIAWAISIATGRKFSRFWPKEPGTCMVYNVEDDDNEQRLRLSAALHDSSIAHRSQITPADIAGRVIRIGPTNIGTLLRRNSATNRLEATQALDALEALIAERKPDVVFLDPFVELHDAEENDNTAVRAVMARLRAIAKTHACAVCILHHARKGIAGMAGDPDTLRGASSIVGAARVVITIMSMAEDESNKLGVAPGDRLRYFRVDGAKSNYSALNDAEWFERIGHELKNGDTAPAARAWTPTHVLAAQTPEMLNEVLDAIAEGAGAGVLFTATAKGNWCGRPLMDILDLTEAQAKPIIATWFKSGLLTKVKYHHPVNRRDADGVAVNHAKRPTL